jgi:hypothetical protein
MEVADFPMAVFLRSCPQDIEVADVDEGPSNAGPTPQLPDNFLAT